MFAARKEQLRFGRVIPARYTFASCSRLSLKRCSLFSLLKIPRLGQHPAGVGHE